MDAEASNTLRTDRALRDGRLRRSLRYSRSPGADHRGSSCRSAEPAPAIGRGNIGKHLLVADMRNMSRSNGAVSTNASPNNAPESPSLLQNVIDRECREHRPQAVVIASAEKGEGRDPRAGADPGYQLELGIVPYRASRIEYLTKSRPRRRPIARGNKRAAGVPVAPSAATSRACAAIASRAIASPCVSGQKRAFGMPIMVTCPREYRAPPLSLQRRAAGDSGKNRRCESGFEKPPPVYAHQCGSVVLTCSFSNPGRKTIHRDWLR